MTRRIQQISQFEPISLHMSVRRKDNGSLTPYTLTTASTDILDEEIFTFDNAYFVPVYQDDDPNYTTLKFQASLSGVYEKNYPVQSQWNFDDGTRITLDRRDQNVLTKLSGTCFVAGPINVDGSNPSYDFLNKSITITTSDDHGLVSNTPITIKNMIPYEYNGTYIITDIPSSNEFTIKPPFGFLKDFGLSFGLGIYEVNLFPPVYHKFSSDGPANSAVNRRVSFSIIDNKGRKITTSQMLYPKLNA